MVEFWERFGTAISTEYVGKFEEIDALELFLRPDSGMLYAGPRLVMKRPPLKPRTSVQVHSLLVEGLWNDLPDSTADAAAFEAAHHQLMTRWISSIRTAAEQPRAAKEIQSLLQKHPMRIYGFEYDDQDSEFRVI